MDLSYGASKFTLYPGNNLHQKKSKKIITNLRESKGKYLQVSSKSRDVSPALDKSKHQHKLVDTRKYVCNNLFN